MRKSLASHARERMFLEEQRNRRSMLEQLLAGVTADNRHPVAFDIPAPEATARAHRPHVASLGDAAGGRAADRGGAVMNVSGPAMRRHEARGVARGLCPVAHRHARPGAFIRRARSAPAGLADAPAPGAASETGATRCGAAGRQVGPCSRSLHGLGFTPRLANCATRRACTALRSNALSAAAAQAASLFVVSIGSPVRRHGSHRLFFAPRRDGNRRQFDLR
jgi:hypothetical protein